MVNYKLLICVFLCTFVKTNAEQNQETEHLDPCYVYTADKLLRISGRRCQFIPTSLPSENITRMVVENTAVFEITNETLGEFPNILYFEAVRNKISTIEKNAFYGSTELTILDLSHNRIRFLSPQSLEGLQQLTRLILVGNSITFLKNVTQALKFSILPSLEYLDLSGNKLESIKEDDFLPLNGTLLKKLVLESCNLADIHPDSFLYMPNLNALNLAKNELTSQNVLLVLENFLEFEDLDIRAVYNATSLFPVLKDLKIQRLLIGAAETIKIVKNDMFPPIPTLRELSILDSGIEDVEDYAFENLPNLTSLTLRPFLITNLPKGVLLSKLEYLSIQGITSKPKRIYFEDHSFARMTKLRSLDLSYLFLIHLKKGTFIGLTNLKYLDLKRCGIHSIEENTFDPLANLEYLDVTNNTVLARRNLITNMFPSLKSLKHLVYRYGMLENLNITQKPFKDLVNLECLDLGNGLLTQVIPELFEGLKNLVHLNLQENQIREWSIPLFSNLTKLETVNISSNWIVTTTDNMLQDFKRLRFVDVSNNPFNCSCSLLPFLNWTNSTDVTVVKFYENDNENYLCDSPKELFNFTLYDAHRRLAKECNLSPSFTALISLAVILIVILLVVVGCYIYKLNAERRLWLSEDKKNFTYDAFVSYSANDSDWVFNCLLPRLECETSDLKLCVYDRDFVAGRGISECILDSIQCSRRTILVLSNNFLQSPWCRFETDLAHHTLIDEEREGLLLIKLENLSENLVNPQLNYLLKTKIYLAWSQDPKEQEIFWRKLHKALKYDKKEQNPESSAKIV